MYLEIIVLFRNQFLFACLGFLFVCFFVDFLFLFLFFFQHPLTIFLCSICLSSLKTKANNNDSTSGASHFIYLNRLRFDVFGTLSATLVWPSTSHVAVLDLRFCAGKKITRPLSRMPVLWWIHVTKTAGPEKKLGSVWVGSFLFLWTRSLALLTLTPRAGRCYQNECLVWRYCKPRVQWFSYSSRRNGHNVMSLKTFVIRVTISLEMGRRMQARI